MTRLMIVVGVAVVLGGCSFPLFGYSLIGDKSKGAPSRPYFVNYRKPVPDEIRRGVDAGDAGAQAAAGYFYDKGEEGFSQNDGEALRLYRLAAAQGNPAGLTNVGVFLAKGRAVKRDDVEAARLFSLVAQQDFEPAQVYLAAFYLAHRGKIAEGDPVALKSLRAVVDREMASHLCDNVYIVLRVARLYEEGGEGFTRDPAEATRLYDKLGSSDRGGCNRPEARERLAKIPANSILNRQ